jgi:hypothetical protein
MARGYCQERASKALEEVKGPRKDLLQLRISLFPAPSKVEHTDEGPKKLHAAILGVGP